MLDQVPSKVLVASEEAPNRGVPAGCGGTLGRAIRRLEELDHAQAVVARILLSELGGSDAADTGRPLEQTVVVTPGRLQAYEAISRISCHTENVAAFLRNQVAVLRDVTFWASAHPAGSDGAPARFDEVALFNIVEIREWSDDRDGPDSEAAVHWLVRGGLWAGSHLRHACRGALCRIARASLDPVQETAALLVLRLGSLAMAQSCPGTARAAMTTTVGDLLTAVGRLPVDQLRTVAWGQRTATDLCDAARSLQRAGIFAGFEAPGLPPDGALEAGAVDAWLNAAATFAFDAENG